MQKWQPQEYWRPKNPRQRLRFLYKSSFSASRILDDAYTNILLANNKLTNAGIDCQKNYGSRSCNFLTYSEKKCKDGKRAYVDTTSNNSAKYTYVGDSKKSLQDVNAKKLILPFKDTTYLQETLHQEVLLPATPQNSECYQRFYARAL